MTKKEYVEKIITVSKAAKTEDEFRSYLHATLGLLEPEDRRRFALWSEEISTSEECWD